VKQVFLDANVLLYCFDDGDPKKRDRAREWVSACWTMRCGRISMQVLNEFYSKARTKFPSAISAGDARAEVRRYQHWQPWPVDHPTLEIAWAIESRYGLNYSDALIVAAAQVQGCTHLITEDLQHEQRIDNVQILNPFLVGPELLDAPAP
jgi:predicted nucleic acid-binding protein